jgi:hypothetical protein
MALRALCGGARRASPPLRAQRNQSIIALAGRCIILRKSVGNATPDGGLRLRLAPARALLLDSASAIRPVSVPLGPPVLSPENEASVVATPGQQRTLASWIALELALLLCAACAPGTAAMVVDAPSVACALAIGMFALAWLIADLVTGIFHWAVRARAGSAARVLSNP